MSEPLPSSKPHFLGKGVREIYQHAELNQRMYWIMSSMEKFQKEVQDCKTQEETLQKLMQYFSGMEVFEVASLYRVNEEQLFEHFYCSHEARRSEIETLVSQLMRSGRFAWALQQNRETIVDLEDSELGHRIVLHGMSSSQQTFGMVVGVLKEKDTVALSTLFRVLSLMIDATVFVVENRQLQSELKTYNRKLERVVESRTQELLHTNEHLHLSNQHFKKLSERKSELLGIAAHDLKNPLSGMLGATQLISMILKEAIDGGEADLGTANMMCQQIEKAGRGMADALNDLINSEAMESGKISLVPSEVNLTEIMQKVVLLNQTQATNKSIVICVDILEDVFVYGDPLRLQEAMDNLVSNAVKYSPVGARVWLSIKKETDQDTGKLWAVYKVRDEGPGISDSDQSKLFGRFQKLTARPTAGESSSGLGLSIFKKLVELHHGEVMFESELGKGSTFGFKMEARVPTIEKSDHRPLQ
jgi:signal transduction histidine kinase